MSRPLPWIQVGTNAETIIIARRKKGLRDVDQWRERLRLLVTYRFTSRRLSLMREDTSVGFCLPGY